MPGLLALILNMKRFNSLRIWPTIRMMLPVLLQPIESIKTLAVSVFPLGKKNESKSKDEEFSFPVVPAISAGAVLGLGMLLVLVGLDEEFAEFLRIADIWDIIAISFWTFLLNIVSFFWFAWHPTFVSVDDSHATIIRLNASYSSVLLSQLPFVLRIPFTIFISCYGCSI